MEIRNNAERCLLGFSGATPSYPSLYNNFKTIVQGEDAIVILIEMVHDARVVRMNSEHPRLISASGSATRSVGGKATPW